MPPSIAQPLLDTVQYYAPPSTVEPTTYKSFDEFKKANPNLYAQYVQLADVLGHNALDHRARPLPQELNGWPEIFSTTRATSAATARNVFEQGHDKNFMKEYPLRPFSEGSSKAPYRSREDSKFTRVYPKIEPLDESDVFFGPDLIKMGLVSAFLCRSQEPSTLNDVTDCLKVSSGPFGHSSSWPIDAPKACEACEGKGMSLFATGVRFGN